MKLGTCGIGYSPHGAQEAEELVAGRGQGKINPQEQDYGPRDSLPSTRLHLPQFYLLLIVYSNFESINGLNYSLG
jgi:hypothetical protein